MTELPLLDPIVEAFIEKLDNIHPDGTSSEDFERDLDMPIKALRAEIAALRARLPEELPHTELLGKWNALTYILQGELGESSRVWDYVREVADVIVGERNAARSPRPQRP